MLRHVEIRSWTLAVESCNTAASLSATEQVKALRSHRGTYPANISTLHTLNLLGHLKSHLLIDGHIGIPLRAFKITRHSLCIRLIHDSLHESLPNSHPSNRRADTDDIAEVVTARIRPDFLMCVPLHLLIDPISREVQPATTEKEDIVHELPEGQKPVLRPYRPRLWRGCFFRGIPPAHPDDATRW